MSNFEAFLRFGKYLGERFHVRKAEYDGIMDLARFEVARYYGAPQIVSWPTSLAVLQDESAYHVIAEHITRAALRGVR